MRRKLGIIAAVALLNVGIFTPTSSAATIGYILIEAVQSGLTGIDMNLEPDAEDLVFLAEIELESNAAAAGILNHINRLREQGHTVHFYGSQTDDQLGIEHMEANNDLIILSETPGSGDTGSFYVGANIPVILCESYLLDDYQLQLDWETRHFGDEDINAREFRVVKDHPITRGLPEVFAPLATDPATGKPYIGNWTVLAEGNRVLFPDNVLINLVDPVAPIPQENDYVLTEPVPVIWAFEPGEAPRGNPARLAFVGWGTENPTGVGLADHPLFADGSTSGIYAFDVMGDLGWQLWDQILNWALGIEVPVNNWPLY